ncbi:hypothetical protein KLP28_11125 [Nocardioidaceae bacterium]|nr:hypothetical protein KLP28_11125 [Nocardioidaceae bacterium]
MDMSGMIFVALAVVWAVYLIPRAVNRSEDELALLPAGWGESPEHESDVHEQDTRRSDERVSQSGGRGASGSADAPGGRGASGYADAPGGRGASGYASRETPAEREAARTAVGRRRRVLLTLLGLTGVTAVAAVTVLPAWVAAVPAVLVAAWLVVCRVQVRRLEARRAERLAARAATTADADAGLADEIEVPAEVAATEVALEPLREFRIEVPDSPAALVVEPDEDTVGLTEADREAALADEMPRGAVWDPRPLTLPTYITKPRARRVPRTMALDGAGVSSSGRDARDSALVAEGAYAGVDATARPREAVGS